MDLFSKEEMGTAKFPANADKAQQAKIIPPAVETKTMPGKPSEGMVFKKKERMKAVKPWKPMGRK